MLAFDYDGVLAPIVEDPDRSPPHARAVPTLARLAPLVGSIAIITGRPASVVVAYGQFDQWPELADLVVFGHYGRERWPRDASSPHLDVPILGSAPRGLVTSPPLRRTRDAGCADGRFAARPRCSRPRSPRRTALAPVAVGPVHLATPAYAAACGPASDAPLPDQPWPLRRLRPERVWSQSRGSGITVAVIDSGVSDLHPILASRLVGGFDLVDRPVTAPATRSATAR